MPGGNKKVTHLDQILKSELLDWFLYDQSIY